MRRTALAFALIAGATLSGCVGADGYNDRRYVDRETVYQPYPVYRGGSTVYRNSPGWGWGNRGYDDRRYRDRNDDDDRYVRAPWDDGKRREGRYDREGKDTVCDRRTEICYKDGHIDKTETNQRFGNKAAGRADDIRDRYDNRNVYVPRKNVACDGDRNVCLENGKRDVQATRQEYGKKAAEQLRRRLNNNDNPNDDIR